MSEIKLLKKTVKALATLAFCYRIGRSQVPDWVFKTLDDAKEKYGFDLTKIK